MTDYVAEATKTADEFLATVAKIQDNFVEAVAAFVKALPELPKPAVEVPVPADLPKAEEVTAAGFDFAEKVLAQGRATSDKLFAALTDAKVQTLPGESTQQVLIVDRPSASCSPDDRVGLVADAGTVVGSVLWEGPSGSSDGPLRTTSSDERSDSSATCSSAPRGVTG